MRAALAIAAAAALGAAGCGGGHKPTRPEPAPDAAPGPPPAPDAAPDPDHDSLVLPSDDNIVPGLKVGAENAGCRLAADEPMRIAVACDQDTIFIQQVGREIRWSCQTLDREACKQLFAHIAAAAQSATGGP